MIYMGAGAVAAPTWTQTQTIPTFVSSPAPPPPPTVVPPPPPSVSPPSPIPPAEVEPTDKELEELELEALQAELAHEEAEAAARTKRRNKNTPATRQRERKMPRRMNV
jgi:hypothetical protein